MRPNASARSASTSKSWWTTTPQAAIIATGSASFDLARKVSEPLTGRKLTFTLYPASYAELAATVGLFEARAELERWLIWGGYPGILTADPALRERLLGELVGSYLYRDILELGHYTVCCESDLGL